MMKKWKRAAILAAVTVGFPLVCKAQGLADEMNGLKGVLEDIYSEMMPLCSHMIGIGQGIAGFAALWYIASRVWRHLANAEPIDFYPLFRPFVIGFCVMIFPSVLAIINGVMKPTVTATAALVENSDKAVATLLQKKQEAVQQSDAWKMYVGWDGNGDRDRWYKYTHDGTEPSDEGFFESIGNDIRFQLSRASYDFRNSVKQWMSEILQVLFQAASLCIDTLRTFQLVILAILGPLVFGLSVFDGLQHTLTVWLARYINIYLWLPVANIFGAIISTIQEKMLTIDLAQIKDSGDTFFSATDVAYLVFLIIGIVGYFTVPSVANYIVHAGGGGALGHKVTSLFGSTSRSMVGAASGGTSMALDALGNAAGQMSQSMASRGNNAGYFADKGDPSSSFMGNKLKGNS